MTELVLETDGLGRRFGKAWAVRDLSLRVPRGSVFGFLGMNGAGKTTTIRMLLGLLEPSQGRASVFGMDPRKNGPTIRRRTGYVAENQRMYGWMTVTDVCRFVRSFYPTWNDALVASLLDRFHLTPGAKLGTLSAGQTARVALTLALAHEPELLVLDDPTSGLDAVVRRDFLESIIGLIHEQGRTVLFSSHLIHEVERVADWIGIIHQGALLTMQPLDKLKSQVKQVRMVFRHGCPEWLEIQEALSWRRNGREAVVTVNPFSPATLTALEAYSPQAIEVIDLPLEDIFVELVGERGGERHPGAEEPGEGGGRCVA